MKYKYLNQIKDFLKLFPRAKLLQKVEDTKSSVMKIVPLEKVNFKTDVYFSINGIPKIAKITSINALYIDLDAGRDNEGIYLSEDKVIERKRVMLHAIDCFPIRPSIIIETRNGYHVYWNIQTIKSTETLNIAFWERCQEKIFNYFQCVGADITSIKKTQILRLPYTTWYKRYEGYIRPFFIKIVYYNTESYNIGKFNRELNYMSTLSTAERRYIFNGSQLQSFTDDGSDIQQYPLSASEKIAQELYFGKLAHKMWNSSLYKKDAKTTSISEAIDTYIRMYKGSTDIFFRAMENFENSFIKKVNDEAWKSILNNGYHRSYAYNKSSIISSV